MRALALVLLAGLAACTGEGRRPDPAPTAEAPEDRVEAAHRYHGEALLQQDRFEESIAAFDRALAIDPDDVGVRYLRAFALFRHGQVAEADAAIADLLFDLPEDHELRPALLCARALHAEQQDREDDAIGYRIRACALDEEACCP